MIETNKPRERAILIGILYHGQEENEVQEFLEELSFLAETAGADPVERFIQKLDVPNPRTFVGSGKIKELAAFIGENKIDIAIFDDELSPSQIEKHRGRHLPVVSWTAQTLFSIFLPAGHGHPSRSTQVELAQYQYLLPRLTGMWTHLERQRGGIGSERTRRNRN